jgi:tRNA-specific 2-thiouridylase
MASRGKKIVVAMSGGVDSSVSAALLVEQGYDVAGIMLRLWSEPGHFAAPRDNRCCTRDQMLDAHFVARQLGIPFKVVDVSDTFKRSIVDLFVDGYRSGITPNPCLACNRHIRFGFLLDTALSLGASKLATGHYAQVTQAPDGAYELRRGADAGKDQSYVLSMVTQRQLSHAAFPVGGYTKDEVREIAASFDLPVASKGDSQDLCFVADGDYRRFLREAAPESMHAGPIVLRSGEVVGQHEGLPNYTIGQRRGVGISWAEPLYVLAKRQAANTLVVGTRGELGRVEFSARDVNWISGDAPAGSLRAEVKIRYRSHPAWATVTPHGADRAAICLDEPLPDVTPGQGAVFYDGDRVVGGGLIALED